MGSSGRVVSERVKYGGPIHFITAKLLVKGFWFLHNALLLIALSQCVKFHLIPIYNFRDMLHTNLLQKLGREIIQ